LLDKLIAIGGLNQEEMFEVQVKVAIENPDAIDRALKQPPVSITRSSRRNQYDTYFLFAEAQQGRIRYREDEIFAKDGEVSEVRYLLTYTQPAKEREFAQSILLSRARFTARADRSLRFYREYFRPSEEREINKERRRYHIMYQNTAFMINVDRITQPSLPGYFMEIKSRTWSPRDAEKKAALISELLTLLGVGPNQVTRTEYVEI
jgi:adenylate cyclase class IV